MKEIDKRTAAIMRDQFSIRQVLRATRGTLARLKVAFGMLGDALLSKRAINSTLEMIEQLLCRHEFVTIDQSHMVAKCSKCGIFSVTQTAKRPAEENPPQGATPTKFEPLTRE